MSRSANTGRAPDDMRASSSRSDVTRARILTAATRRFAETGFAGASTRSVAAEAQVNVATLAYHFGGKDGLYEAALNQLYESLLAFQLPASLPAHPRERLRRIVTHLYRFARSHRTEVRLLLRHVVGHGSLPQDVRDRWNPELLRRAAAIIAELELPQDRDRRLDLLSLNHLIARYAISDLNDLSGFTDSKDPEQAIAEHLANVACQLLLSPAT